MASQCIYQENDMQLFLGNEITLVEPENDPMFHNSSLGKFFKEKRCDKAVMTVKQHKWLEVYFELSLSLDGKPLTLLDVEDDESKIAMYNESDLSKPSNKEFVDRYDSTYIEKGGYSLMRYLVKKGATITKNRL
jgi:hypothetical protein